MLMQLIIVSENDAQKIVEAQLLKKIRLESLTESLEESRMRLDQARRENEMAKRQYHEALLVLAEDEDDDFATALEKREKFERVEAEFITVGRAYEKALLRVGWEAHEAEKASLL